MKHDVYDQEATSSTRTQSLNRPVENVSGRGDTDKQEMMKRAEAASAPGAGHKALEHFVGDWKADVKCWMEPGAQPEVSQATAKIRWIMNGRFIEEDFQGQMMGKPFHGRSILGFDNVKQVFKSMWVDDMNTGMFTSEGKGSHGNAVLTLEGKSSCAATGRIDVPAKMVLRVVSPDKHVFEMFDGSKGEYTRTLEINYTRQ